MFPGFDGLMTLSRREGVDIRPTLLRVLTDLYVQASSHTLDEETQFVELASRLIEQVDDATLAVVRGRLAIYPHAPAALIEKLAAWPGSETTAPLAPRAIETAWTAAAPEAESAIQTKPQPASTLAMQAKDAAEISAMFFAANSRERALILRNLADAPLKPAARIPANRMTPAIQALEMAAFAQDIDNYAREIADVLLLTQELAQQIVRDPGGEPLACAAKALAMPSPIFQRVLMFLDPATGSSVNHVYRLSRLYDVLSERSALIMIAAWRGARLATTTHRTKHQPALYDDERQRARSAPAQHSASTQQPGSDVVWRNNRK